MLRLTTHIERLLLTQDCVILPGIGGFVLQASPSTYRKEEHYFLPMHKEIVFNKALQHNDGLLLSSYMNSYQVDYQKAQLMLEEDTSDLKTSLNKYGKAAIGKIGSFTKGTEGQWIFQPGQADLFDVDYYGLSSFYFPVLPVLQDADPENNSDTFPQKRKGDIFYIPVNIRFVRGLVASVAAIILFLFISTPVEDVKQSAYTASLIPCEMILPKATTPVVVENTEETVSVPSTAAITPSSPASVTTTAQQPIKMYHIIIGSFPSEEKADEYFSGVDKETYTNAGIVVRDGRHRVYACKFDNRNDAEAYLESIRQTTYKDAWLFIARQ